MSKAAQPDAYIRQSRLLSEFVPFSAATLWRNVGKGTFPQPVKLSERVTAWRVQDVQQWLHAQRTPAPSRRRA